MPEHLLVQPFFLLGLAGVAWLFLGGTLCGFAMFLPGGPHKRLLYIQSLSLALLLALLAWGWARFLPELQAVADGGPLGRDDILDRRREGLSLILLGVSAVFNALVTAFCWVRVGRAGNAFRSGLWAVPALRAVGGCVALFGLFADAAGDQGEPLPDAELAPAFAAAVEPLRTNLQGTALVVGALAAVSLLVTLVFAQRSRAE